MICTVAISTFNSADYLRAFLGQLCNQSLARAMEVVVIDSGSGQDEAGVCREWQEKFTSLRYFRTPRETLYSAWNRALAQARGEFFVNANTDDALHPEALETFSRFLAANADASLAYCDWLWAETPNLPIPWPSDARVCRHEAYQPWMPLFYAYAGCHQFWRTEKLRQLGGFDERYRCAGDYEILCRLAERGGKAVHLPETLSAFFQNPEGLSRSSNDSLEEFYRIRDNFRERARMGALMGVDGADARATASAWLALARHALALRIPWATEATPDVAYARTCAEMALRVDPANADACAFLERTALAAETPAPDSEKPSCSLVRRIMTALAKPIRFC